MGKLNNNIINAVYTRLVQKYLQFRITSGIHLIYSVDT